MWQIVEKWKYIDGFNKLYQISNLGRVRSYCISNLRKTKNDPPIIKVQSSDQDGYKRVNLYMIKNKKKIMKNKQVHRLVLIAFKGPCPKGMEASHLDGDRTNNVITNLIWETHLKNNNRKKEHGTYLKGENSPLYGKIFSKERRQKLSMAKKKYYKEYPTSNLSEDTRKKLRNAANKRWGNALED